MANAVKAGGSNSYEGGGGSGGARQPRLPRWTRQEILVLIQGKRMVEGRGRARGGRGGGGGAREAMVVAGGGPVEPKWASVSSYCRRQGVDRAPVQCRKRWSNLASDFKKIKEWEEKGKESFWAMRNDTRRERKLPGFFDREVYDILDGTATGVVVEAEAAAAANEVEEEEEEEEDGKGGERRKKAAAAAAREAEEAVFDSGRTAAEDGLFSDFEEEKEAEEDDDEETPPPPAPVVAVPISEKKYEASPPESSKQATANQPADHLEKEQPVQEGPKRQRTSQEGAGDTNLQTQLIEVLDRNSRMLTSLLEAHNNNCQLDREQRKDQTTSLLGVLGKLADALGRIADKL